VSGWRPCPQLIWARNGAIFLSQSGYVLEPLELGSFIDNCFNTVPARIENESGKTIGIMFRMQSHSSVIATAFFKRRPIETGYSFSGKRSEGNVETLTWRGASSGTKPDCKLVLGTG
jgi:hypothetical protein